MFFRRGHLVDHSEAFRLCHGNPHCIATDIMLRATEFEKISGGNHENALHVQGEWGAYARFSQFGCHALHDSTGLLGIRGRCRA